MAIYFIESKYKEIFKLKQMLEKEKIPFDFTVRKMCIRDSVRSVSFGRAVSRG